MPIIQPDTMQVHSPGGRFRRELAMNPDETLDCGDPPDQDRSVWTKTRDRPVIRKRPGHDGRELLNELQPGETRCTSCMESLLQSTIRR